MKLFKQLLDHLGSPKEQKTENVALAVIYCMFLSFNMVVAVLIILAL